MQIKFEKYIGGLNAVLIFAKFVTLTQSGVIEKDMVYWIDFNCGLVVLLTIV